MIAIHPVSLMLAVLADHPAVGESVAYLFSGLLVVFLTLGGVWGLLEISGAAFRRVAARDRTLALATADSISPPQPSAPVVGVELSALTSALIAATVHAASQGRARILSVEAGEPAVVHAIIAAAVHCVFEGRARVVSVNPMHSDSSWAREGRRDIFSSHRIR